MVEQKEQRKVCFKALSSAKMMVQMVEHPMEHQKAPRLARRMVQLIEYPKKHQKESLKVHMTELWSVIL